MRELEFLPAWYAQTRRRQRIVVLEGWILFALIASLVMWLGWARHMVHAEHARLASLKHDLDQTYSEERILAEQLDLRKQLQAREQIIAALGFPVEMTRLLQTLDAVMPKEMTLLEFITQTDEQARQATVTPTAPAKPAADIERLVDRRLKVRLVGVAPSNVDLANFLAGLSNVPFFDQLALIYARDRIDAGHVQCEFEVTFSMNLNQPTVN